MTFMLASTSISAAISPGLSINLLNRKCASVHDVDNSASITELPITVSFLDQVLTTHLSFVVTDRDVGFEVVLGHQWESCCKQNKGR